MSMEENNLLFLQGCSGSLKWEESASAELPIIFDLKIQKSGQGLIEIITSDPAAIGPLSTLKRGVEDFSIAATGPEGQSIDVRHAYISRLSIGANNVERKYNISATIVVGRMSINLPEALEQVEEGPKKIAEYFVKGLERTLGFSGRLAPWTVAISSETKTESPNTISARMLIELDDDATSCFGSDEFLTKCDNLAQRILEVLSVSVGTSLAWSLRKTFVAGLPTQLLFRSTQEVMAPVFPMFHSLNLAPALDLALSKHTSELRKSRGLDVAIYWALNHSPKAEAHYLHLMTAVEHMVSRYAEGRSKARFDKKKFVEEIRPALFDAAVSLEGRGIISDSDLKIIEVKLGDLNRVGLREGIEGMLAEWHVRFDDLAAIASVGDLVAIRNRITHQGALPEYDDEVQSMFWKCLDVLIELVKRIFMSTWSYQGKYISHLNEYHEATYSPSDPIACVDGLAELRSGRVDED